MCIVKFKLKNFKSYKDEAEFSFEAQPSDFKSANVFVERLNDGREMRLLKTAVVYGPNASGKSNLIWGLRALSHFVRRSREYAVNKMIDAEPFALDEDCLASTTEMTLDFISSGIYYSYHIEYTAVSFVVEELYEINQEEKSLVFSCNNGDVSYGSVLHSSSIDARNTRILRNHLLLSELATRPSDIIDVYYMIANIVAEPVRERIDIKGQLDSVTTEYLKRDGSEFSMGLKGIISKADMGISSMRIIEHGEDDFKFPDSMPTSVRTQIMDDNRWEYRFVHKGRNGVNRELQIHEESTGTQRAFTVGTVILKSLKEGGMLAYDEMGMALHPRLFKSLVQMFCSSETNPNNAQLLFTSHDTSIISDDMMRADQVWFTEKNEFGESELYSAQDFEDASINMPFEEFYRRGRFGARPNITELL